MSRRPSVAVVGGGAAGYFLAVSLGEMCRSAEITILEGGSRVLRKVRVSGGGRCNVTNTFENVTDLRHVYPRLREKCYACPYSDLGAGTEKLRAEDIL